MSIVHIAKVTFRVQDYDSAINTFEDWLEDRVPRQVCIVNVHTLITATREPAFHKIMREAAMNTMDGQPLRWYANAVCRAGVRERVCGPELMRRCIDQGVARGWRHYLLGGRPEVLQTLRGQFLKRFPGVEIAGSYSPPFRKISEEEEAAMVARINDSSADFLWVGLGAPRQEQWIARNLHRLNVPVCVGVGAAFDFHAGTVSRAPVWMQSAGLEWIYRACADPRLFRRYFDTNPPFLWMLARDWVKARVLKISEVCGER